MWHCILCVIVYCLYVIVYCLCFTVYCLCVIVYCLCVIVYCLCVIVYCLCFTLYCLCFTLYCLCFTVYCPCVIVYCLCVIVVYSFQSGNREDDTQTLPCIIEHVILVLTVVTVTIHTYIPRPTPADLSGYEVCYKKLYSNAAYHHLFQNGDNICNVKLYTTLNQTHIKEIYNIFTQYSVTSIKVL